MFGLKNPADIKHKNTDKNFLIAEQKRLTKEYANRLDKTSIDICPYILSSFSFRFQPEDRISIEDLIELPNTILVGKVFVCRTITPSIKILSLLTVVEAPGADLDDRAVFLSLHNYQHPLDEKQETSIPIFIEGTILAIRNPMFFLHTSKGMYTVKCDNPADIFVLSPERFEDLFPELNWPSGKSNKEDYTCETNASKIMDSKSIGHYWCGKKNHAAALQYYTAAVDQDYEDMEALILRCSMFLQLKLYQMALTDATQILEKHPLDEEGIRHKANSLIGLSQYTAATEFLKDHIKEGTTSDGDVENVKLKEILEKAKDCISQERYGQYDLVKMLRCGIGHNHDCADYVGSVVEQKVPGKGRGLIATENIKSGQLIIAMKAFDVAIAEKRETQNWLLDTETRGNPSSACAHLRTCIAHRMIRDSVVAKVVYNMYDGTEKSDKSSDQSENEYINMGRVTAICSLNAFSQSSHIIYNDGKEHVRVIGLWPVASLFNYGCFESNSIWKICGNIIFVRASRDIKKGEEVTLLYVSYMNQYPNRIKILSKYKFSCKCPLCLVDSLEPTAIHNRRKIILHELKILMLAKNRCYSEITQLIEELQQQRLSSPELNVYTIWPMIRLAKIYISENKYSNAALLISNVLKITCTTVLTEVSVGCCLDGLICALNLKDLENVKIFATALKVSLTQEYGIYSEELVTFVAPAVGKATAFLESLS